jgi:hypothetical protein
MQLAKGIIEMMVMIPSIPDHPSRVISKTVEPIIMKGKDKE